MVSVVSGENLVGESPGPDGGAEWCQERQQQGWQLAPLPLPLSSPLPPPFSLDLASVWWGGHCIQQVLSTNWGPAPGRQRWDSGAQLGQLRKTFLSTLPQAGEKHHLQVFRARHGNRTASGREAGGGLVSIGVRLTPTLGTPTPCPRGHLTPAFLPSPGRKHLPIQLSCTCFCGCFLGCPSRLRGAPQGWEAEHPPP